MKQPFLDIGQLVLWDDDSFKRENKCGEHCNCPLAYSPERVSRPQSKRGTQVEPGRVEGESLGGRGG